MELHLIKGNPVVHGDSDLIVGHVSIEVKDISKVPSRLRELGVPFRQNVSVPKGADAGVGTNTRSDSNNIVRQYFIRDPDGYYIEICNCSVLTQYCLGEKKDLEGYDEAIKPLNKSNTITLMQLMNKWNAGANKRLGFRSSVL